jgi:hypothetical protein
MTDDLISAVSVLRNQAQQKRAMAARLREMAKQLEQSADAMDRIAGMTSKSGELTRQWDQSMFATLLTALNRGDLDSHDLETLEDTVQLARVARQEMLR